VQPGYGSDGKQKWFRPPHGILNATMQVVQLSAFFCRLFFVRITLISRRFSSAMLIAVYLATCESLSSTLNERSCVVGAIVFLSLLFLEASSFLDLNFFYCKLAFFIELILKLILHLNFI
jgi:hypothetical protein